MDQLAQKHLIKPGTTTNLISNHLVLIARKASNQRATIAPGFPIAPLTGAGPLAMCDPDSHPAGRYAKASLLKLGVWHSVEKKVASVENPLLAVGMVAHGEAPIAIVFATDAATDPGVEVIGTFPDDTHPQIRYPVAILAESRNPDADRLLAYLKSPSASMTFGGSAMCLSRRGISGADRESNLIVDDTKSDNRLYVDPQNSDRRMIAWLFIIEVQLNDGAPASVNAVERCAAGFDC